MKIIKVLVSVGAAFALLACNHDHPSAASTPDFEHEADACPNWSGHYRHGQNESFNAQTSVREGGVDFNDGRHTWIVDGRHHDYGGLDYRAVCHNQRIFVDTYHNGRRIGRTRY